MSAVILTQAVLVAHIPTLVEITVKASGSTPAGCSQLVTDR